LLLLFVNVAVVNNLPPKLFEEFFEFSKLGLVVAMADYVEERFFEVEAALINVVAEQRKVVGWVGAELEE
jgi:hypothetical protein